MAIISKIMLFLPIYRCVDFSQMLEKSHNIKIPEMTQLTQSKIAPKKQKQSKQNHLLNNQTIESIPKNRKFILERGVNGALEASRRNVAL